LGNFLFFSILWWSPTRGRFCIWHPVFLSFLLSFFLQNPCHQQSISSMFLLPWLCSSVVSLTEDNMNACLLQRRFFPLWSSSLVQMGRFILGFHMGAAGRCRNLGHSVSHTRVWISGISCHMCDLLDLHGM
jgi:hypothetical protein